MRGATSYAVPPNAWLPNVVTGLTAAGSTQGTALVIPLGQDSSILTTVAASTGVILPGGAGVGVGEDYSVANHGANAVLVYPAVGGKIGTLANECRLLTCRGQRDHLSIRRRRPVVRGSVNSRLYRDAAVRLQHLEAERRELQRLHAAGVRLSTLARMSRRSEESLRRLLNGDWRS